MTWDEFKAYVDAEMKRELGLDGSVKIWYIDIGHPEVGRLVLEVDPEGFVIRT